VRALKHIFRIGTKEWLLLASLKHISDECFRVLLHPYKILGSGPGQLPLDAVKSCVELLKVGREFRVEARAILQASASKLSDKENLVLGDKLRDVLARFSQELEHCMSKATLDWALYGASRIKKQSSGETEGGVMTLMFHESNQRFRV
jgi:hypothetical protein